MNPKMENAEDITTQHIEYTRTVVPSTMRSPYWKFFGFPSDNSNNVLTKQKIICTLCNAVIAYNKNTSNLRTHIVARHPELLIELYNEKNRKNIEATTSSNTTPTSLLQVKSVNSEPVAKRAKVQYVLGSLETNMNSPATGGLKPYNETIIVVNEPIDNTDDKNTDNSDFDDFAGSINHNTEYSFEEIEDPVKEATPIDDEVSLEEHILELLITDLHPPSIVQEAGFVKFMSCIESGAGFPHRHQIEQQINKLYNKSFDKIQLHLTTITNTTPYSLSIEFFQNIENKAQVCIYFNYLIPVEGRMQLIAYTTVEITQNLDLANVFIDFNLSNCTAVIISEDNELLEHYFTSQGIPIIPCFESVVNNCMIAIFALPAVDSAYKRTVELFEKHDCASMLDSIPEMFDENPWSKFNFLQFLQDHLSMVDDEHSEAIEITKQLVGFLSPLKTTLETIADEPLPLCSLMKPLSKKLIEEYFSTFFCETEVMTEVKNIVVDELSQRILNNMFLSEASFFDPRFQNEIVDIENLDDIKDSITHRFGHLFDNNVAEHKPIKLELKAPPRKSSLKLFFNRGVKHELKPAQGNMKRSLEYEIMKYTGESADLEQCPMKWWEENEFIFRKLRKISHFYMCVPCCATKLFKLSLNDRISFTNRRFMLRKNISNQILFLHLNKDVLEKFKNDEQLKKID